MAVLKLLLGSTQLLWLLYMCLMLLFMKNVLDEQNWSEAQDDLNIGCFYVPLTVLSGTLIVMKCNFYVLSHIICKVFTTVRRTGPLKVLVLCAVYVVLVTGIGSSLLFLWRTVQHIIVHKFEENILHFHDFRFLYDFENVSTIPGRAPENLKIRSIAYFRYQGEDVELNCTSELLWFPNNRPHEGLLKVLWKRDNHQFTWSARYSQKVSVVELPEKKIKEESLANSSHLSFYSITAMLQIRNLKSSDFGRYTCEAPDVSSLPLPVWSWLLRSRWRKAKAQVRAAAHEYSIRYKVAEGRNLIDTNMSKTTDAEISRSFHTGYERGERFEFHKLLGYQLRGLFFVLKTELQIYNVTLSPGAIFSYTSGYWQLENEPDDISVELQINKRPIDNIGSFWQCSKFLWFYFMLSNPECWLSGEICSPPLAFPLIFKNRSSHNVHIYRHTFCVGPGTFGHLQMGYYRPFYNAYKKQHQLVYVPNPDEFLLESKRHELFSNYVDHGKHVNELLQHFPTEKEMQLLENLATERAESFYIAEYHLIFLTFLLSCIIVLLLFRLSDKIGSCCQRWLLRKEKAKRRTRDTVGTAETPDTRTQFSQQKFRLYCSYCDINEGVARFLASLFAEGEMFLRSRDIPPNLQELSAADIAISNSERFIIILSEQCSQHHDFEVQTIINEVFHIRKNPKDSILVIKIDDCEVHRWAKSCTVQDWTTFEHLITNIFRLDLWLNSNHTLLSLMNMTPSFIIDTYVSTMFLFSWVPFL